MKKSLLIIAGMFPLLSFTQTWTGMSSGINNDLNSVSFADDQNGWAVGRQGKVLRTTDGGATWTEQNSGTTKDLNKVYMIDASTGFAVGKTGTVIKYNGSTWSALNINFSQDMHGVYFLDASTGWISGDWGRIMMTTNGGSSWTTQVNNSNYSNLFRDLYMISASEGWAVGTSGRVLKYNGSNWSNVTNPASGDLYAVHFDKSGNGFMTGKNSSVFEYTGSWSTHNTALPDNSFHVYDVHVVNGSVAYAATAPGFGGAGIILKYNGNTWVKDYEYSGIGTELFYGITVTPGGKAIAVGAGGTIKSKGSGSQPTGLTGRPADKMVADIYPNPSNGIITLNISTPNAGDITVEIHDAIGRLIKQEHTGTEASGTSSIQINLGDCAAGTYFCTISAGEQVIHRRIARL